MLLRSFCRSQQINRKGLGMKNQTNRIREFRVQRNMSMSTLAERAGTVESIINRLETSGRGMSVHMAESIAKALGVSTSELALSPQQSEHVAIDWAIAELKRVSQEVGSERVKEHLDLAIQEIEALRLDAADGP